MSMRIDASKQPQDARPGEGAGGSLPRGAKSPIPDLRLSLLRDVELPWRLPDESEAEERSTAEILALARETALGNGSWLLSCSDPSGRQDLIPLIANLLELRPHDFGLFCSGEGLDQRLLTALCKAGVRRIVIPFHSARADAHDWLFRRPGALKSAARAIRTCLDAGVPTTAEIVVTRPTAPHLGETVDALTRLGVRSTSIRRLRMRDAGEIPFVSLSPRLALLRPALEAAATVALDRRARVTLRDFPLCVAPRLRPLFARAGSEIWLGEESTATPATGDRLCPRCPDAVRCSGVPMDYVERFGWEEFREPAVEAARVSLSVKAARKEDAGPAMVLGWQGPNRMRCAACADHTVDEPIKDGDSTRRIRERLVHAARFRPSALRLTGAELLAHPRAPLLIQDALRLFRQVEIAAEASPIVEWTDVDLRRLKGLHRFDAVLYGPDATSHDAHCGIPGAFEGMMTGLERLYAITRVPIGAYAILHDATSVLRYAAAWNAGELPGAPAFRLSPQGGSLDELVDVARQIEPGDVRSALLAVLPACLCERVGIELDPAERQPQEPEQTIRWGRSVDYEPASVDRRGSFGACDPSGESCGIHGCVGRAVGWRSTVRAERWLASS